MANFNLYLDESGDFLDDASSRNKTPSLVGGLLIEQNAASAINFDALFPFDSHATEHYIAHKTEFFSILQEMRNKNGHFLLFNNEERLRVVNGDITYLNVLSQGIVQLLRNLRVEKPDELINLYILVANRQAVDYKEYKYGDEAENYDVKIEQNQYFVRLAEKLLIEMGRYRISGVSWTIAFDSARRNKKLMVADLICNTYLTRTGKSKFSDEDREFINSLYEPEYQYSVFENATIGNLKRLFIEKRYGEMMYQLSELPTLGVAEPMRNVLLQELLKVDTKERECWLNYMSLQISLYNAKHLREAGVYFAQNYKAIILKPLLEMGLSELQGKEKTEYEKQINYWIFDTDFFILTLYDHLGNIRQCEEYAKECRRRIGIIDHSWEYLDYYYKYCIRELNIKLNFFDFEDVLTRSSPLLELLKATKNLFMQISKLEGETDKVKSGRLGSLYGVRLQAYTNLIRSNPELFPEAIALSDMALKEFDDQSSLERQYLYRCQLLVEVDKMQEALESLLKSVELDGKQPNVFSKIVDEIYKRRDPKVYVLYHYTNVDRNFMEKKDPIGQAMYNALISKDALIEDIAGDQKNEHPWNLILWNISVCHRIVGKTGKAKEMYKKAIKISTNNPDNLTMYSHALSISAENVLFTRSHSNSEKKEAEDEYKHIEHVFRSKQPLASMGKAFPKFEREMSDSYFGEIARAYLK